MSEYGLREVTLPGGGKAYLPKRPMFRQIRTVEKAFYTAMPPRGYHAPADFILMLDVLQQLLETGEYGEVGPILGQLRTMVEDRADVLPESIVAMLDKRLDLEDLSIRTLVHHWEGVRSPIDGTELRFPDDIENMDYTDHEALFSATLAVRKGAADPLAGGPPSGDGPQPEPSVTPETTEPSLSLMTSATP